MIYNPADMSLNRYVSDDIAQGQSVLQIEDEGDYFYLHITEQDMVC